VLSDVGAAGDVRRDEDALVVPEAAIRLALELPVVDVQGHAAQRPGRERGDQRLLVEDLSPCHVHQDGA